MGLVKNVLKIMVIGSSKSLNQKDQGEGQTVTWDQNLEFTPWEAMDGFDMLSFVLRWQVVVRKIDWKVDTDSEVVAMVPVESEHTSRRLN